MKARDGDAQMKNVPDGNALRASGRPGRKAGHCPACKTEVPPKSGFRFSSLKCPKCGTLMGKQ